MALLLLFLTALSAWWVLVLIKPQVMWYLRAWAYRDPEANYPSDTWFTVQRLMAGVMLVVVLVAWGWAWDGEGGGSSEQDSAAPPELTASHAVYGRISHYAVRARGYTSELEVYVIVADCARLVPDEEVALSVSEDEETVTVASDAVIETDQCVGEAAGETTDTFSQLLELEDVLGERRVVDVNGREITTCC